MLNVRYDFAIVDSSSKLLGTAYSCFWLIKASQIYEWHAGGHEVILHPSLRCCCRDNSAANPDFGDILGDALQRSDCPRLTTHTIPKSYTVTLRLSSTHRDPKSLVPRESSLTRQPLFATNQGKKVVVRSCTHRHNGEDDERQAATVSFGRREGRGGGQRQKQNRATKIMEQVLQRAAGIQEKGGELQCPCEVSPQSSVSIMGANAA